MDDCHLETSCTLSLHMTINLLILCRMVSRTFREPCRGECRTVPWHFCLNLFIVWPRDRNLQFWLRRDRRHRQTVCFLSYIWDTCLFWGHGEWYSGYVGTWSLQANSSKKVQFPLPWSLLSVPSSSRSIFSTFHREWVTFWWADADQSNEKNEIWLYFYDP